MGTFIVLLVLYNSHERVLNKKKKKKRVNIQTQFSIESIQTMSTVTNKRNQTQNSK